MKYICRPEDAERAILKRAMAEAEKRFSAGETVEVKVDKYRPGRTDPQLRTLWMWHGEVAAHILATTGRKVDKETIHDGLFKSRWMPKKEIPFPDGTTISRPMGTSESNRDAISQAMDAYLAWAYENEIELTIPDEGYV